MARRERKRFVKGNEKPFKINRTSRGASVPSGNPKVINPGGSGVINDLPDSVWYLVIIVFISITSFSFHWTRHCCNFRSYF